MAQRVVVLVLASLLCRGSVEALVSGALSLPRGSLCCGLSSSSPRVTEHVIGLVHSEEEEAEAATLKVPEGLALASGIVPNVLLGAALVMGGLGDETTRALCAVAIAARAGAYLASRTAAAAADGSLPGDAALSGALAVLRAKTSRAPERAPLVLGSLSTSPPSRCVVTTMEMVASKDSAGHIRTLLEDYHASASSKVESLLITQPTKSSFAVTTRFESLKVDDMTHEMRQHHTSDAFLQLVECCRPFLATPIATYLVTQIDGQLGNSRHPFGPGGEGGRDDAIYSSPANLDGSQVGGGKIGVEAARTVDL